MEKRISGHTGLMALFGTPVGHSGSPAMYNFSFQHDGLDYAYMAFDVTEEEMPKVFESIRLLNMRGGNFTMPCKNIAAQLERRISFRRAMKQCIGRTMKLGAKGIKTRVSGRLGGAEIARAESYHEGTIPLQTIRADIDYGFAEANTTYGKIGVKVWIYKGEVLKGEVSGKRTAPAPRRKPRKEGGSK